NNRVQPGTLEHRQCRSEVDEYHQAAQACPAWSASDAAIWEISVRTGRAREPLPLQRPAAVHYPEIPPQVCDGLIRRRHTLLAPLQVSEGRRNREQAYDHQCADLGPEEQVVSVIVPPLVAKIARPNPTNTISPASMPYQASIAATRRAAAASM